MSQIDQIMSEKQEDVEVKPNQLQIMSEKQEDVEVNANQPQENQTMEEDGNPKQHQTMEEDGNPKQHSVKEESHEYANENSQQHENPEKEIHEHVKEVITEEGEENNEHIKKVITEQVEENKEEAMEIERKIVEEGEKKTLDVDVDDNENKSSEESKEENKSSEESEEKEKKNSKQKEKKRNRIMNMCNNYKKKQENVQAQSMKFKKSFLISEDFTIVLQRGDITKWSIDGQTDAIVNAANKRMIGGAGVDGAIHRAAGDELYWACKEFPFVEEDVRCPVGEARITRGFNLPARYVIHTVGPDYDLEDEPTSLLADAYRNSLNLAKEYKIKYVAFPAISCGIYGCPYEEGAEVSLTTVREFAQDLKEVHFILFEMEAWNAWLDKANELFAQEEPEVVN